MKKLLLAALIAVSAIGCGVTPDETVTTDTVVYEEPSAPVEPTEPVGPTIDPTVEIKFDFTYVCMMEGHPHDYVATDGKHNVFEPMTMNLLHKGVLGNPGYDKRLLGGEMFCAIIEIEPPTCEGDAIYVESTGECISPLIEITEELMPGMVPTLVPNK